MLGLDGSGKTSILNKLDWEESPDIYPTIGNKRSRFTFSKTSGFKYTKVGTLEIWEVGGQANIRSIWRQHLQYVSYLIWVVDASNFERIQESKEELHKVC
jgi:GTPase SAR1 family protein